MRYFAQQRRKERKSCGDYRVFRAGLSLNNYFIKLSPHRLREESVRSGRILQKSRDTRSRICVFAPRERDYARETDHPLPFFSFPRSLSCSASRQTGSRLNLLRQIFLALFSFSSSFSLFLFFFSGSTKKRKRIKKSTYHEKLLHHAILTWEFKYQACVIVARVIIVMLWAQTSIPERERGRERESKFPFLCALLLSE